MSVGLGSKCHEIDRFSLEIPDFDLSKYLQGVNKNTGNGPIAGFDFGPKMKKPT